MEFTVIDASVIRSKCMTTECSKTDIKDDLEDLIIEFKEIGCLDLSCLNILHIANLNLLSPTKLTSLKLSVNRIEKICNLDLFTNLVELDLSHNHIKQIENLQGMVMLRRLILNHNPLTTVQNLDGQRDSLEMLDIGYCSIADLKFTLYLRRFKNLVSLITECNPFQIKPADSEREFLVSLVPSLLVYNNKTVTAEEKKEALETYRKLIAILEENESKWKKLSEENESRSERMKNRKNAFLDHIPEDDDADFNVSVFQNSSVEQILNENSRYGIYNVYRVYAENFRQLINEITTVAESSRETRIQMVNEFREKLRRLVDDGVDGSRRCVSRFAEYKKRLECDVESSGSDDVRSEVVTASRTAAAERFDRRSRAVWLTLMGHEDELSRKITEMIGELRDVLDKQIAEFKLFVNNRFCVLQRQQNVFLQFVLEYAVSSTQSDDTNNRFCRVSQFTNDISHCMESQATQLKRAESYITTSASDWLDNVLRDVNGGELQRNRQKILEIATFLRTQNEAFKQTLQNCTI